jgi:aspartyl/asparaginyl beta-hydroxylase (cupin superfamily)
MPVKPPQGLVHWFATHVQNQDTAFARAFRICVVFPFLKITCGRGVGFYRTDVIPGLKEIEQHYDAIREECLRFVQKGGPAIVSELVINPEKKWKQFRFFSKRLANVTEEGRRVLPLTTELFERYTSALDSKGASVAVLEPGGRILPHADLGMDGRYLRFHFGVDVPSGCAIRCAGEETTWPQGAWIAMDERKLHSCVNRGTRPRVIIIMDLHVPADLRVPARSNRSVGTLSAPAT